MYNNTIFILSIIIIVIDMIIIMILFWEQLYKYQVVFKVKIVIIINYIFNRICFLFYK